MIKQPLLTLLVGFTLYERDLIQHEILKTDRCTHPITQLNYSCPHPEMVHKVVINNNRNFQKEYTFWYHQLPSNLAIAMYSLDIETKEIVDEVDHYLLFSLKSKELNLEMLNELGYTNQEHFKYKKFNYE